ncbi:hypothetical protein C8Q79DRAFT_136789 [Trametes meyenii]|nr:hypothetical protein C8Q79DRAFT_136789 [Trametes meyenii]
MRFTFATLVIAAFSQGIHSSPLTTSDATSLASKFPVSNLDALSNIRYNTTLGHGGLRSNAAGANLDPTLIVCESQNCAGNCIPFNLAVLPNNECFSALTNQFVSAGISDPTDAVLPFQVLVGSTNCASTVALPAANECFNLNGAVFNSFARIA